MFQFIMLQTAALNDSLGSAPTEETLSIFELLLKGGWVMIPISVLGIAAVYIFFERYLTIKKARKDDPNFIKNIRDHVLSGNLPAAKNLSQVTDLPIARMIEKGVQRIGKPLKDIEAAVENVGRLEVYKLEKNIAILATISGAAPMIGFLGTVTGMIKAFYQMSKAGNNLKIDDMAGGIFEAMITTAAGLVVGIIAYMGYNYIVSQIEKIVYKLEADSIAFIDLLQEPA